MSKDTSTKDLEREIQESCRKGVEEERQRREAQAGRGTTGFNVTIGR